MRNLEVTANGMVFRGVESGPEDGALVLLAHGFPDSIDTWRHLHGPLADPGYRVVAPAMRGYAPSDVPSDRRYQTAALAQDLVAIRDALGGDGSSVLIGHDWGALAAYGAAALAPEAWRAMVTMAVPPMPSVGQALLSIDQLKRSWYIFFFQTPAAEFMVSHDDFALIARLWADWSPGYDASADVEGVRRALDSPERIAAAVGYYRAMFDLDLHDPGLADAQAAVSRPSKVPTLYLHGESDGCFGVEAIGDPAQALGPGSAAITIESAGHFLHLERPEVVAEEILRFLGPSRH